MQLTTRVGDTKVPRDRESGNAGLSPRRDSAQKSNELALEIEKRGR